MILNGKICRVADESSNHPDTWPQCHDEKTHAKHVELIDPADAFKSDDDSYCVEIMCFECFARAVCEQESPVA